MSAAPVEKLPEVDATFYPTDNAPSFMIEEKHPATLQGAFDDASPVIENPKRWKPPAPAKKGSSVHLMSPKAGGEKHSSDFFDADQGGAFITPEELKKVMFRMGDFVSEQELDAMVQTADKDGDGKIDYEEFLVSGLVTPICRSGGISYTADIVLQIFRCRVC